MAAKELRLATILAGLALLVGFPLSARAADTAEPDTAPETEPSVEAEARSESGTGLDSDADVDGAEIYRRVLANRHQAYFQKQVFLSGGEGEGTSETELWVRWKDMREDGKPKRGTLSKTLAKYTSPRGVRGMGYLVVQKAKPPNDQLVYFPSARRVRRVNLGESIMGTDFSLEDIVPREMENSSQQRHADEEMDGKECFVIDVVPNDASASQYSKLRLTVEKEHYVPLQTRYWSHDDIEVKQYTTLASQIEEVEGVWLTREGTMRDLVNQSYTTARILEIEPNAKIKDSEFSERSLIGRSR